MTFNCNFAWTHNYTNTYEKLYGVGKDNIENDYIHGIEVDINSTILNIKGFPFRIFPGDNVNDIVLPTTHNVV